MAFDLSLHESITAIVFLLVCGKGAVKLATHFRQSTPEAGQEDIELGSVSVEDVGGDA